MEWRIWSESQLSGFVGHMLSSPTMKNQEIDGDQRLGPGEYSDEEAARRRDAVVKRMLNTPPQPRGEKPKQRPVSKGRVHKGRTRR